MGKLMQVVVYLILVLSCVALFFANALFCKRELLQNRNVALEDSVIRIAKTIEAEDAKDVETPEVMQDISEVSDRELATPEKKNVLADYNAKLETANLPTLDLGTTAKRLQLRAFYVVGPDGKYVLNPVTQRPDSKGKGTMSELLGVVYERAKAQQAVLNKTRAELEKVRNDVVVPLVGEINTLKAKGREVCIELKETKETVVRLEGEKAALEDKNRKLENEKKELNAELADQKDQNDKLNEEKLVLQEDLDKAQKTIEEMKKKLAGRGEKKQTSDQAVLLAPMTAGDKGKIVSANNELKFCIVEFTDASINELLGEARDHALPQLEMSVRRPGRKSAAGEFVTRIKLRQWVKGKNLVIADILADWEQAPSEKNDVVFL